MSAYISWTHGAESSGVLTNRRGKIVAGREIRAGIWAIRVASDGNRSVWKHPYLCPRSHMYRLSRRSTEIGTVFPGV